MLGKSKSMTKFKDETTYSEHLAPKTRIEEDAIGKLAIPADALYGINALRAHHNFTVTNQAVQPEINQAMVMVKLAAAYTNQQANTLDNQKYNAIHDACGMILSHFDQYQDAFITPAIQGGAGTSTNMNANEVVANLASQILKQSGKAIKVDSHNDVNQSQSTNDAYPTAGKIAMLKVLTPLMDSIEHLIVNLEDKAAEYKDAIKVGRTQLQDALPTTFGRTFHAFASMFKRDLHRLTNAQVDLSIINMGATAIGTGMNASPYYQAHIAESMSKVTKLPLTTAEDLIDDTQNCDSYVEFSGALKALAVDLAKMANDFRLLGSGPQAGLNELMLPKVQAGSSIMPGKINPVIPEAVVQAAYEMMGTDTTVTLGAEHGELELNAFEPIMFEKLIMSEKHMKNAIDMFIERCLKGTKANVELGKQQVESSAVVATILNPVLGYDMTTKIVKKALSEHLSVKKIVKDEHLIDDEQLAKLFSIKNLTH